MHHAEHLPAILAFLAEVGIDVRETALEGTTFLPGIAIRDGALLFDRQRLQWPGDLLHEAGHLAVLPAALRPQAQDDLQEEDLQAEHAGELEALAWAYAAAARIGIPIDVVVHEGGYKGQAASLLLMYSVGIHPGLRGLCETGMTHAPGFISREGSPPYPHMLKWLRD
jgi:hypothetical protein